MDIGPEEARIGIGALVYVLMHTASTANTERYLTIIINGKCFSTCSLFAFPSFGVVFCMFGS